MTAIAVTAAKVGMVFPQYAERYDMIAAETITAGQIVFLNTSGKAELADADASGEKSAFGVALTGGGAGQGITVLKRGHVEGYTLTGAYGAKVYLGTAAGGLDDASQTANEVQTVTVTGSPTGGTFTLTFGGEETSDIAFDAAASAVQSALEALATIGTGNVTVTGSAGGPYTVTFINDLGGQDVALLVADGASLTGGTTPDVTVAEATSGSPGDAVGVIVPMSDSSLTKVVYFDFAWL